METTRHLTEMATATASASKGFQNYNEVTTRISEYLQKAAPLIVFLGSVANTTYPYILLAWTQAIKIWTFLEPYHPEEFGPVLVGLVVAYFGGHFFTLFAAIEAYRLCGFEQTKKCLLDLYKNYQIVLVDYEKDNEVDDNHDGIPDVQQITSQELLTRKLSLILKSMDPVMVTSALSGIWMGFLGVVAVLRLQFAQTIALGATVGHIFESVADRLVRPILEKTIPDSHHKWIPIIISYGCKTLGVSVAWTIQRVISAFYSSIRGAQMLMIGLITYLARNGYHTWLDQSSLVFAGLTGLIAWTGFAWQLQSGFTLPFPLNVLLFPLTVAEWFITWMVAVET